VSVHPSGTGLPGARLPWAARTGFSPSRHLGRSLSDEGVHIIDPFVGTGTFPVRLLQSGLIKPVDLARKYTTELHANEIVLLAYYIAAVNIEAAYAELAGDTGGYQPFEGIVLVDTFQLAESGVAKLDGMEVLEGNSERAKRQKAQPIMVVIGNPPYSVGQESQDDDNRNVKYETLDARIAETYAELSSATLKRNLYDSYVRAIRWASDRLPREGVVAFVSNGGYIDGNTYDGLRKSLIKEFDAVYCYNLRGNQRTHDWKREGGKIFGAGSQNTVAILILVKGSKDAKADGVLSYRETADYLSREDKLRLLAQQDLESVDWRVITPSSDGDWINQRDAAFAAFQAIGEKERTPQSAPLFNFQSNGIVTGRDSWAYNYSDSELRENMRSMIDFYNSQSSGFAKYCRDKGISSPNMSHVRSYLTFDPKRVSWNRADEAAILRGRLYDYDAERIVVSMYRPFTRQYLYMDRQVNATVSQVPQMFPGGGADNIGFYITGTGSDEPFSLLMTDAIPDLHAVGTKSIGSHFPRYSYRTLATEDGFDFGESSAERHDNITDAAVAPYRSAYSDPSITKDDIFFYTYALLHSREYRDRFAADLKKSLPRIPRVRDFRGFAAAGRKLSDLHLGYEAAPPYAGIVEDVKGATAATPAAELYRVTKMKIPKVKGQSDRSTIIYNTRVTLSNIPEEAYRYQLGARSAIEWIIDRYQVKADAASGIINDPNDWSDDPRYIIDLLKRIVTVSLETMKIVDALPALDIID
jgi:predicted helicase